MPGISIGVGFEGSRPRSGGGGGFTPASLFSGGFTGWTYDVAESGAVFQERSAHTTPSADNGVVGTLIDFSGSTNNATAPADAARPLLRSGSGRKWLEFDGSDDCLAFLGSGIVASNYTVVVGFAKRSVPGGSTIPIIGGSGAANNENLHCGWADSGGPQMRFNHFGNDFNGLVTFNTNPHVVSFILSGSGRDIRFDGASIATSPSTAQLVSYAGSALCRDRSTFGDHDFYAGILINKPLSGIDLTNAEAWVAARSGVTL